MNASGNLHIYGFRAHLNDIKTIILFTAELDKKMAKKAAEKKEKNLFVKSAIKELIKSQSCKTSSDVVEKGALNEVIKDLIVAACGRAKANKRTTVYPRDL